MNKLFVGLGIALVVVLAIVGVLLYLMYLYNPALLNGMIDARYPIELISENLVKTQNEFTLSFWYYVEGWKYKYNETKTLLNWDNGKLVVDLKPKDNTMVITMLDLDGNKRECVVEDIKLQKWNFVCLTLWNRSLDVILDDKYSQSCAQDNSPNYSNSSSMNVCGKDGFNGKVSNIYFYDYARKYEDSLDLYYKGPFYKSLLLALSNKIRGSIKVKVSVDVDLDLDIDGIGKIF
jgi:hypothetical protein